MAGNYGKGMVKPSVPGKVSGSKGNGSDRLCGTIGANRGNTSPSNIAGGSAHPSQPVKARSFGTHPDNAVGESEPNISSISATSTRNSPNMGKRVNDSPGAMKRGRA